MRILSVHNAYIYRGGEDVVRESELALLRSAGHEVVEYLDQNAPRPGDNAVTLATRAVWSRASHKEISRLLRAGKCDVAHFHNIFFRISPSAYYACAEAGVPVVQTLHNYRFICPAATLFRDGHTCEECIGRRLALPGIFHRCYRGSAAQSAVVAAMTASHRAAGTWHSKVKTYIALSEFAKAKFIQGGLPAEKIVVKPNFSPDVLPSQPRRAARAFCVSRLSREKGVDVVIRAWQGMEYPLDIAGEGPCREEFETLARTTNRNVRFFGAIPREAVVKEMQQSNFIVMGSRCYENFPVVLAESFAAGRPVIAPDLGSIAEYVEDGTTGLLYPPGDSARLAEKVRWAFAHPDDVERMGKQARQTYELRFTPERNYAMLMNIYEKAIAS